MKRTLDAVSGLHTNLHDGSESLFESLTIILEFLTQHLPCGRAVGIVYTQHLMEDLIDLLDVLFSRFNLNIAK